MKFFMETLSWKRPKGTNRLIFQVEKTKALSVPMPHSRLQGGWRGKQKTAPLATCPGPWPKAEILRADQSTPSPEPLAWGAVHEHRHISPIPMTPQH